MVKMTLGSSTSQGASASSISQQRVSAYEALIGSLQNFGGEEGLTGAAYDSAKNYATSILVPLLQGAILLSEGIGQAVPRLPQKYQAEVGGEDLDSAVLESEIAAYNSSLRSQHNLLRMLSSADEISPSAIQRVSQGITNTTKLRNDAMEKLQKLNAFANSSNSVFDGVVSDVEGAVQAGLAEIGSSFASFNGTFSGSSPSWAKKIAVEWRKKEEIDKNYQKVLKRLEDGKDPSEQDIKAIQAYAERYPNRELPENVKEALKKALEKVNQVNQETDSDFKEFLVSSGLTSLEELSKYGIDKIKIDTPDFSKYFKYFVVKDKFGNIQVQTYAKPQEYLDDLMKSIGVKALKGFTIAEVNVPIPGTNTSVGLSGVSSVFMGLDFVSNLKDENAGRAFMHTATTTAIASIGMAGLSAAAIGVSTAIGTGSAMTFAASVALGTTPIGWVIAGTVVASFAASMIYDNNVLGIKDIANSMGDNLNKDIEAVGQAFDSGIKSIQKVFGW